MTTEELAAYYSSLLIYQYVNQPKAKAQVEASVTPVFMDQIPIAVQNGFDVGTAVGKQLDVIGKYVGVSRNGYTFSGPVSLTDADYRTLLKLVILSNNAGSSLATIQALLAANFPGQILVSDNQAMGLNYLILESLGTSDLLEVLTSGGYLPAPMGVQVSVVVIPEHQYPFFGFRTVSDPDPASPPSPFNSVAFYQTTLPWLSVQGE